MCVGVRSGPTEGGREKGEGERDVGAGVTRRARRVSRRACPWPPLTAPVTGRALGDMRQARQVPVWPLPWAAVVNRS